MTFYLCVSGCGRYPGAREMVTSAASRVWGLAHAEAAFVDESCTHCGRMTISELRSRLQLCKGGGVPVPLPRSNPHQRVAASGDTGDLRITVSAFPRGTNPLGTLTLLPLAASRAAGGARWAISKVVHHAVSFERSSRWPDVDSCIGGVSPDFAGDDASAQFTSFGYGGCARYRYPEMMAMLSRAANRVGLRVESSTVPEPSRLDDWFLGVARAVLSHPPRSFLPGGAWRAHWYVEGTFYCPKPRHWALLPHPPLMAGAAKGYTRIPPVEREGRGYAAVP